MAQNIATLGRKFVRLADDMNAFMASIPTMRRQTASGVRAFAVRHQDLATEMAFLSLFTNWELFLDSSFIAWVVTGTTYRWEGKKITSHLRVREDDLARRILLGDKNAFVDWTDPDMIQKRAKLFFADGDPFDSCIGAARIHLGHMKTIRNRLAHSSGPAKERFQDLLRSFYGTAVNMSCGALLRQTRLPPGLPAAPGTNLNQTVASFYTGILRNTAVRIARL